MIELRMLVGGTAIAGMGFILIAFVAILFDFDSEGWIITMAGCGFAVLSVLILLYTAVFTGVVL